MSKREIAQMWMCMADRFQREGNIRWAVYCKKQVIITKKGELQWKAK